MDYVLVDLSRMFAAGKSRYYLSSCFVSWCIVTTSIGQAYVALSRATSLEFLQVLGFDFVSVSIHLVSCVSILTSLFIWKIITDARVIEWYKSLER